MLDMRSRDGREGPLHPSTRTALAEVRDARAEGDRADQPPRLVDPPLLPIVRARLDVSRLRRLARPAPALGPSLPSLRAPRAGAGRMPGLRLGDPGPRGRRQRADRGDDRRGGEPAAGLPARLRLDRALRRRTSRSSSASTGRRAACWSARRWSPRATTSPTSCSASCSMPTRPCAFPTSGPRSARFALVAQLAGRSGRGARGGRVLVQTLAPGRRRRSATPPRHDSAGFIEGELARRSELGYPPFSHLIRVELTAADGAGCRRPHSGCARRWTRRCRRRRRRSGRRRGFACAAASGARSSIKAADRAAAVAAVRETVDAAAVGARAARRLDQRRRRRAVTTDYTRGR